jgi:hypothetical protein
MESDNMRHTMKNTHNIQSDCKSVRKLEHKSKHKLEHTSENKLRHILTKTFLLTIIIMSLVGIMSKFSLGAVGVLNINLLNQDPDPARAGDTAIIRFQVQNTGDAPLKNINIALQENYPFTVVDQEKTQNIPSLAVNQAGDYSANIQYTIKINKDASRGTYPLRLKYSVDGGSDVLMTFNIDVSTQDYAQIIYLDRSQLMPGQETDMNFTVNNLGNAPLQNLVFSWNEETGVILPVYSDNTRYIKYLDAGESVQLNYKVVADVNANPGLYQLDLNLKYESVNNVSTTVASSKAGVFIGGQTDFDVTFSESTQGQTSLSIANIGNNPAESVTVRIPNQANYRVTGSSSSIVGNLAKGDYTLVSFQISSRNLLNTTQQGGTGNFPRQAGQNSLNNASSQGFRNQANSTDNLDNLLVIIDYTDTTGARVSVQKSVPIQFRGSALSTTTAVAGRTAGTSTKFIGGTMFWIIVIVVVGAAIYFITKRKYSKPTLNNSNNKTALKGIFKK